MRDLKDPRCGQYESKEILQELLLFTWAYCMTPDVCETDIFKDWYSLQRLREVGYFDFDGHFTPKFLAFRDWLFEGLEIWRKRRTN